MKTYLRQAEKEKDEQSVWQRHVTVTTIEACVRQTVGRDRIKKRTSGCVMIRTDD